MRAAQEGFGLEAPELLESVDEFGDGIGLQILSVFPTFVLQQTRNSLAVRRLVPQGLEKTELVWTCFGFTERRRGDDRAAPAAGQPDRPGRLHLDGGRRRAGLRAARLAPAPPTSCRWSRWAARASPPTTIASPRRRCAASGRPTASTWGLSVPVQRRPTAQIMTIELQLKVQDLNARYARRSTTTSSKPGRISSSSRAAIASPPRRTSSAGCRSA